jgi:serine kinase of HPr protein (carbohydrate metabolism regulator)
MTADTPTIHASAVLVGAKAVLIRGPAGAGKSRLAWDLIQAADPSTKFGALPFARLVADDRVHVEACAGQLLVRPAPALAGLIEIHGLGIRRLAFEPVAAVALVVDLAAADAARLPGPAAGKTTISGVTLPRLAVAAGMAALPQLLASLRTVPAGD